MALACTHDGHISTDIICSQSKLSGESMALASELPGNRSTSTKSLGLRSGADDDPETTYIMSDQANRCRTGFVRARRAKT